MNRKLISIVSPCYNEEGNVEELYGRVRELFAGTLARYDYEHIFIDNASIDRTPEILRDLAAKDRRVKVIFNARNFGHIRSPYYGLLQAKGDAVVLMVSDLQDPPQMVVDFIENWEKGWKVVIAVKDKSHESPLMFAVRKAYYKIINRIAEVELVKNYTGYGLYDQVVIENLRQLADPYPYFRGLIAELGFPSKKITFVQPTRKRGLSANNFYTLYDIGMLGITSHSKLPLRLATFTGFVMSGVSLLVALVYLVYKLLFWNMFSLGTAPVVIGMFFFASMQLFFIGIIGEYVGFIYTQVLKRPLVVERERLNF